jgi:hypothetical protein
MSDRTTWLDVCRRAIKLPALSILMMAGWIIGISIVAVLVGNKYGTVWGFLLGIMVGPLVLSRMLRATLTGPSRSGNRNRKR